MDINPLSAAIASAYASVQEFLFTYVAGPILYQFDLMSMAEDVFDGIDWFLFGCIQIFLITVILRVWERFSPAEIQERFAKNSKADIFYTLFHRLGFFFGLFFIALSGFFFQIDSVLHDFRFGRLNVESWWPPATSIPLVSFCIYFILLDFVEYLYHRSSHVFNWWWKLHALHHSQTVMTAWSDDRNHIIDDIMHAFVFSFFALLFGVSPSQFIVLVVLSQLIQSWQHANLKIDLGPFKYVLISPMYHRLHHAVGFGHEAKGKPGVLGGCNFGVLFPWWDMIFNTVIFSKEVYPTGVRDLVLSSNVLQHQWQALMHSLREIFPKVK
jgi:sterol desaturase/sphingolipid hydroxylase (fatty acid hydroxylase superfamily)